MNSSVIIGFVFVFLFSTDSCVNDESNIDSTNEQKSDYILLSTNKIANSLPNPSYVTNWLNMPDVKFDANILNPAERANNYQTNFSMAINLGVYSADLIYSSFYDNKQITLSYIHSVKLLAEGIGIFDVLSKSDIIKLESNIYKVDSIKKIAEDIFLCSNNVLNDNNRPEIALLIEVGTWVESLYIAMQLSKQSSSINRVLIEQLSSQRNTLQAIMKSLKYYSNMNQIGKVYYEIKTINNIYDKIFANNKAIPKVTPELFMNIYTEISEIRNKYIASYYHIK